MTMREYIPPRESAEERAKENRVRGATSFGELFHVIKSIGAVQGSQEMLSPDQIIERVRDVRSGNGSPSYVTRTYGLRDKVKELLREEEGEAVKPSDRVSKERERRVKEASRISLIERLSKIIDNMEEGEKGEQEELEDMLDKLMEVKGKEGEGIQDVLDEAGSMFNEPWVIEKERECFVKRIRKIIDRLGEAGKKERENLEGAIRELEEVKGKEGREIRKVMKEAELMLRGREHFVIPHSREKQRKRLEEQIREIINNPGEGEKEEREGLEGMLDKIKGVEGKEGREIRKVIKEAELMLWEIEGSKKGKEVRKVMREVEPMLREIVEGKEGEGILKMVKKKVESMLREIEEKKGRARLTVSKGNQGKRLVEQTRKIIDNPGNGEEKGEAAKPSDRVSAARSFKDLYEAIKDIGDIRGSQQTLSPSGWREVIEEVRAGRRDPLSVTGTHGLRNKVEELIRGERFEKENTYSVVDGFRRLRDAEQSLASIRRAFNPRDIRILDHAVVSGRKTYKLQLPEVSEPILIYRSTGRAAPDEKRRGGYFLIGGFSNEDGWLMQDRNSLSLTKWHKAEEEGRPLTYAQALAKHFEQIYRW